MVSARAVIENILALILVIACTIVWVAHSQYFYMKFADKKTNVAQRDDPSTSIALPNIILCSRSPIKNSQPFTTQYPFAIPYVEEEVDPNIVNLPDRIPMNPFNLQQAEQAFFNLNPSNNIALGKQQIQNLLYACSDVILDCTWQGITKAGYDCCSMVNTTIPTMDGICWSLTGNTNYASSSQLMQNVTGFNNGFLVRLQITADKYQRTGQNIHPGFDLFLSDTKDGWRLINELSDSVYIGNGEGARIGVEKTVKTQLENPLECGLNEGNAADRDMNAMADTTQTPLAACVLDYAIWKCGCLPLFSEFLDIDRSRNAAMDRLWGRINTNNSRTCTISQMSSCVQPYMSYLMPENYQQSPTGDSDVMMDVMDCMKNWHKPCQYTTYATTPEYYTLTATSGFQAEFTVSYSSLIVKQMIESYDMNIIDLASYIGFAAALWFTVGHIIWSIARVFKSMCCKREAVFVEPKKERAPLTPYVNQQNAEVYHNHNPPAGEVYHTAPVVDVYHPAPTAED